MLVSISIQTVFFRLKTTSCPNLQSITYNDGEEKIIYQGKVHTLDKSANDIIKKGSALVISGDIVKRASNLPMKIAVEIRCLKQEAMNNDYQDESGLSDSDDVTKQD